MVTSPLTGDALPHPWMTALLDRRVRGALIELLSVGLCEWFEKSHHCRTKTLIIHRPLGTLSRGSDKLELDLQGVGEADLTVSFFATYYSNTTTVVRVLDSDEIPPKKLETGPFQVETRPFQVETRPFQVETSPFQLLADAFRVNAVLSFGQNN
jgi:hypothetical protein